MSYYRFSRRRRRLGFARGLRGRFRRTYRVSRGGIRL